MAELAAQMTSSGGVEPVVTVGVPAYGRPEGVAATIAQMRRQTLRSLRIIVSDNASEPSLETVVRQAAEGDARVVYHRHSANIGMMQNFQWLADSAGSPYFMWAADDDGWDDNWIEVLHRKLETHPEAQLACGRFAYDDSTRGTRSFVDAEGLDGPRVARMLRYFWKADRRVPHSGGVGGFPVYGLFRTNFIQREWKVASRLAATARFMGRWNAPDSVFIYYVLGQTPIVTTRETAFHYCATRHDPTPTPRRAEDFFRAAKLRQHVRDVLQAAAHHVDYLRVEQPPLARLGAAVSLVPKLALTIARHETAVLRSVRRGAVG